MKARTMMIAAVMLLMTLAGTAQEREKRFGFELSGGGSMALTKPEEVKLNPGFGFEGIFHYRFMEHAGIYGGWGWNRFGADQSFAGDDVCFEETGYVLGLQFKHPVGTSPLSFYLRGAALYNHIEIENASGDIIHDTEHGYGWQAAGGLHIPLGTCWSITPGVKFNYLNRESVYEGTDRSLNLRYLSLRVGIVRQF